MGTRERGVFVLKAVVHTPSFLARDKKDGQPYRGEQRGGRNRRVVTGLPPVPQAAHHRLSGTQLHNMYLCVYICICICMYVLK